MSEFVYRVHPAIGLARVGNSEEYYIEPETMAGLPVSQDDLTTGGLPIKPGTESETITSSDLRDANKAFKRQAARFRIFQYPKQDKETYPNGGGTEIQLGCTVNGKKVTDIIWTVHLANKKANWYVLETNPNIGPYQQIIEGYENDNLPPLRNLQEGPDPNNLQRLNKLTIDPGPRTIQGSSLNTVKFDDKTVASFWKSGSQPTPLPNYPKSFPDDYYLDDKSQKKFPQPLYCPVGNIDTLGELKTDEQGRLLVLGGYGRACAWYNEQEAEYYPLDDNVDNDGWFDDTSDGPVSAVLVFEDGTTQEVNGAWVVCTDPAYAPQTLNVVSLWDDIYNSWVHKLRLSPDLYDSETKEFNPNYYPSFDEQVYPFFRAASLQVWTSNLPYGAIKAHQAVGKIKASDNPAQTILAGLAYIRNPNNPGEASVGAPLMPFHLGDSGQPLLSPTFTQYFFLTQWNNNCYSTESVPQLLGPDGNLKPAAVPLGPGEYLDKAVLVNCLGGRFSPGIDMTFIVRQPDLYIKDWETSGTGPFRIKAKPLDYNQAQPERIFLSEGYVPVHSGNVGLEPGDTSKFMALPWHTDYNSCATHTTAPNPQNSTTLYWSWPAQRPVAVYTATEVQDGKLGPNRYSVRGEGTDPEDPAGQGRYQDRVDFVKNWQKIGVMIQGSAIDTDRGPYSPDYYLEVESLLPKTKDSVVQPWPINATLASDLDI